MIFVFDEFQLDGETLELSRRGQRLDAEPMVMRLLRALISDAGRLVTKDRLREEVWGGRLVSENALTVSNARLRALLGQTRDQNQFVTNIYGRGYVFECPVELKGKLPARSQRRF